MREIKLPSGAIVMVESLNQGELNAVIVNAMIKEWVNPGPYELTNGKLDDPMKLMMSDTTYNADILALLSESIYQLRRKVRNETKTENQD